MDAPVASLQGSAGCPVEKELVHFLLVRKTVMNIKVLAVTFISLAALAMAGVVVHEGRNIDFRLSSFGLLGIQLKTEDSGRKNP